MNINFVLAYYRIADLVEANITKRQTAFVFLKQLCETALLKELKVGCEKLFIHPKLMSLLTQVDAIG